MTEEPTEILTITKWKEVFETSESRKLKRMTWFRVPSGCDSRGLTNLLCEADSERALRAFGVFNLLCQWTATFDKARRGKFVDANGTPMTRQFMARFLRVEISHLNDAIELLGNERVAWLQKEPVEENLPSRSHRDPTEPPPIPRSSPTDLPKSPFLKVIRGEESRVEERESRGVLPDAGSRSQQETLVLNSSAETEQEEEERTDTVTRQEKTVSEVGKLLMGLRDEWKKPPQLTAVELHGIADSMGAMRGVEEKDWELLRDYLRASPPMGGGFWQPRTRSKMIEAFADVLGHATRWDSKGRPGGRGGSGSRGARTGGGGIPEDFRRWAEDKHPGLNVGNLWMSESYRNEFEDFRNNG